MISIPEEENNYTYILRCADGTFYTGWTNDLKSRIASHNSGKGSKYTRTRGPVELVYYEISPTKEEAMSREWHIKQLSRQKKEHLVGTDKIGTFVYAADASALENKELFDKLYEKASPYRKKKTDAIRRKKDKNLSLAAEALLDAALSENKIDIKKLVFGNGKNGKPEIINRNNLYFNLSHSGNMVMCIISGVPVGCDVENTEKPVKNIAEHFFSPAENEFLKNISEETAKKDMFYRIWTLKESFIKNIGTGLGYPLKDFSIIPNENNILLEQKYDNNCYFLKEFRIESDYRFSICICGNTEQEIPLKFIDLAME